MCSCLLLEMSWRFQIVLDKCVAACIRPLRNMCGVSITLKSLVVSWLPTTVTSNTLIGTLQPVDEHPHYVKYKNTILRANFKSTEGIWFSDSASFIWRRLTDSSGKLANLPIIELKDGAGVGWYIFLSRSTCQTSRGGCASAFAIELSKDSVKADWKSLEDAALVWPYLLYTYIELTFVFCFKYFNNYILNIITAIILVFYCCFCCFIEWIGYF